MNKTPCARVEKINAEKQVPLIRIELLKTKTKINKQNTTDPNITKQVLPHDKMWYSRGEWYTKKNECLIYILSSNILC